MSVFLKKTIGSILIWEMNLPKSRNAISRELLSELRQATSEIQGLPPGSMPRVLILQGVEGIAFSAGADLKERANMSETEVWEFLDGFRAFLHDLENLPIPTIACINGVALGGGMEIALACDFRVGYSQAILGLPETRLGIIPGAGGTQRLARLIGVAKAKELIFQGKRMTGDEALKWGILGYCYPLESLQERTLEFASEFIDSAPVSLWASKMAIQRGMEENLEKGLDIERECYKSTIKTKDRLEALQAFREKRKPIFTGE